ncbi:cysteine-tryptophan domain-containing zinc finger protein 7-like isoform X2 [Magnolia sinica]|uniref:cysteine-tryptophan domain-containing zinc finger protein 7-like isoform X2 n=1 Tax=Magnolia sinica TaxID=86752 RepID=UPI00265ACC00|nr:cysteine-tryptophan domain-containing zinc finger protein 7-like isoform X2 [Magnolia sinica]
MVTMLSYVGRRKHNTTFGFNPDVAFSYIDQRLQDVLGHFQKDFERDISADNLGPKYGQYGSFLPMHLRNPLTQSQPKNPVNVHSSNIPKLLKKFENMDSSTTKNTLPVHEKKSLKIRLKIGVGKAPKSNSASFSSLDFKNCPSSPIESTLENKDENYELPSSIVQAKALPVIPANTSLSLASDSFCLEEKDNPSTRSSKTRIDYCETKLLKQPARDSKRIGPSPAFEGDSFILEKEIHKQYMKLKLSKRYRKGNKKCNLQGCSNITKKRKQCSASVAESNLNESTMENNGVFSSARTSTKLFGEMQGKSNITKKRKECSASAGESDLNENPTENGGVSSSAHSSNKLFGNLRHPIQLAEDTLKEAIDLKHSTDRLKNVESEVEVSGIYLRATLKFLLAASMFEVCDMGSATLGEKTQSTEIYIDTSKMLKQCAISFEHNGEIAAAALAYKCVEVAYKRVIFSMSSHIRQDGHELQASLHGHPFGQKSSTFSALDVTNVCQDGAPSGSEAKGIKLLASRATCSSPHLLNYAEYVSSAMDAAQRSLSALKAAQWKYGLQGIAAVKTALDFHFHDMDGFVRLVRLALEEIDI